MREPSTQGIRESPAFERVKAHLAAFPDEPIERADYERAAEHFPTCRSKGVQGSNTDFLLCAIAERHRLPIFTADGDFERYARLLPIRLFAPR